MDHWVKDPNAVLDYAFDWTDWLAEGETISSVTVTASTGLTKNSENQADGVVTVWLSGGTAGNWYVVSCRITTNAGRTDERSRRIFVQER